MQKDNKQPSNLRLWWRSRQLIATAWIAITALYTLFFSAFAAVDSLEHAFRNFFIGLSFLQAGLAAQFYTLVFNRKTYPILPKATSRGLFMVLCEFLLSCGSLSLLIVIFGYFFQKLDEVTITLIFLISATWLLSFATWILLTKIPSGFHAALMLLGYCFSYRYPFYSMLLITQACWVGAALYFRFKDTDKTATESKKWQRFDRNGLRIQLVNYFQLGAKGLHIREFPQISGFKYFSRSLAIETMILVGILFLIVGVSLLMDLVSSRELNFNNRNWQFGFLFCFLYRYIIQVFACNNLENGVSGLMGLSRNSWFKTRQKTKILDRLAIVLAWFITLLIFIALVSIYQTDSIEIHIKKLTLETVLPVLTLIPLMATLTLIRHNEQNQKLFSQSTRKALKGISADVVVGMILAAVVYMVFVVTLLFSMHDHQVFVVEKLSNPAVTITLVIAYLAFIIGAFHFETRFEKITFEKGDLI